MFGVAGTCSATGACAGEETGGGQSGVDSKTFGFYWEYRGIREGL